MTSFLRAAVAAALLLGVSACATGPQPMYTWGNYDGELLKYYKGSLGTAEFAEKLYENVENAEVDGKVPPGLYAEYGYMALENGDTDTALVFFAKERDRWPESAFLMNSVIERLTGMTGGSDATETASE